MTEPATKEQTGQTRRLPRFKSLQEEAEFWDTHSPLDFPEEWEEVEVQVDRPLRHILAVRLDASTIGRLGAAARKKGLGLSTLVRMWLLEKLAAESGAPAPVHPPAPPASSASPGVGDASPYTPR